NKRRVLRHDDGGRNAEKFSLVGEGLRVIAGGSRDHPTFLLFWRQLRERVTCTALLKTSGALRVVEFAENFHPRALAQRDGSSARRLKNRAGDSFACGFDVFERNHALIMSARDGRSTTKRRGLRELWRRVAP